MKDLKQFNRETQGTLLNVQFVPPTKSKPVGFAHERILKFSKANHSHDSFVICLPRGTTQAKIKCARTKAEYLNTNTTVIVQPPNFMHSLHSLSEIYDDFALFFSASYFKVLSAEWGMSAENVKDLSNKAHLLNRSPWLHELAEQLFMKKLGIDNRMPGSEPAIEKEFAYELFRLHAMVSTKPANLNAMTNTNPSISGIISYIEAHLFEDLKLPQLAKNNGLSTSSLQKKFRQELAMSPADFVRRRRLQEAQALLHNQRSVTEVAFLVGYKDPTAFTKAFTKEYGISPHRTKKLQLARKT